MEVGRLASGSWPETFIFPAVSGEEGVGGWQPAVWRVVPAKCGRFPAGGEGQVLATTLCTNHSRLSRHSPGEAQGTDTGEQTVRGNYGRG